MRTATRVRAGAGLVAAIALTIAAVTPVAANAPVVVGERHVHVVRDIPGFLDCGDFLLDYHVEVRRTITDFFDVDGNLTRTMFDIHYKGTLTNTVTGLVARDDGSRMFIDDHVAQTTTLVRGSHHITVPGKGLIFAETGRVVWDWNGTPIDVNDADDIEIFRSGLHDDIAVQCDGMR
jgi:hypothetical protein